MNKKTTIKKVTKPNPLSLSLKQSRIKHKNHPVHISVLVILGIVSVGIFLLINIAANYQFNQLSLIPSSELIVSTFPMSEYSNNLLKFSLFYPETWATNETGQQEIVIKGEKADVSIKLYAQDNLSILDWVTKHINENGGVKLEEDNKMTIANIPSFYIKAKEGEDKQSMIAYLPNNNFVYEIKLTYPLNEDDAYYQKIFKRITSSFKLF